MQNLKMPALKLLKEDFKNVTETVTSTSTETDLKIEYYIIQSDLLSPLGIYCTADPWAFLLFVFLTARTKLKGTGSRDEIQFLTEMTSSRSN